MTCGGPQGSILGSLLWNVAYYVVLRTVLPPGCHTVCYADDTLVVVRGTSWERAVENANLAVTCVVGSITGLGLRMTPGKRRLSSFTTAPPPPSPLSGTYLRE